MEMMEPSERSYVGAPFAISVTHELARRWKPRPPSSMAREPTTPPQNHPSLALILSHDADSYSDRHPTLPNIVSYEIEKFSRQPSLPDIILPEINIPSITISLNSVTSPVQFRPPSSALSRHSPSPTGLERPPPSIRSLSQDSARASAAYLHPPTPPHSRPPSAGSVLHEVHRSSSTLPPSPPSATSEGGKLQSRSPSVRSISNERSPDEGGRYPSCSPSVRSISIERDPNEEARFPSRASSVRSVSNERVRSISADRERYEVARLPSRSPSVRSISNERNPNEGVRFSSRSSSVRSVSNERVRSISADRERYEVARMPSRSSSGRSVSNERAPSERMSGAVPFPEHSPTPSRTRPSSAGGASQEVARYSNPPRPPSADGFKDQSHFSQASFVSSDFGFNHFPALSHGIWCDCYNCTISLISDDYDDDEYWMRYHESAELVPYDFRVMSAKAAMMRGDVYIPIMFRPELFCQPLRKGQQPLPEEMFPEQHCRWSLFPDFFAHRFVLQRTRAFGPMQQVRIPLIYTNGNCLIDGSPVSRAGCGFVYCTPGRDHTKGCVRFALEHEGPYGNRHQPTSDRAQLRAVIAALEWRFWYREGWEAIVIATDSTYVRDGACKLVLTWISNQWYSSTGFKAANRDLWKRLLWILRLYARHGCEIMIWLIPREDNMLAAELARRGAQLSAQWEAWRSHRDPLLDRDREFHFWPGEFSLLNGQGVWDS